MDGERGLGALRALEMLALVIGGTPLSVAEVKQRLGVSEGTARSTFSALKSFPGVTLRTDVRPSRLIYADPELSSRPAVRTSAIISCCVGASLASLFSGTRYEAQMRSFRDALVRRAALVASPLNLDRKFVFRAGGGEPTVRVSTHIVDDVLEGVLNSRTLRLTCENFAGERRERSVDPLSIVVYQHQLYVIALREQGQSYTLRLSRIVDVELTDQTFPYPTQAQYDPDQLFRDSFGIFVSGDLPVRVRVLLAPRWKTYAQYHQWHVAQRVEVLEDGRVSLELRTRICPEVMQWLLSFGADAEVLAPEDLRQKLQQEACAILAVYSSSARAQRSTERV